MPRSRTIKQILSAFVPITNMSDRGNYSWTIATYTEVAKLTDALTKAGIETSREDKRQIYFTAVTGFADSREGLSGPLHLPDEHLDILRKRYRVNLLKNQS